MILCSALTLDLFFLIKVIITVHAYLLESKKRIKELWYEGKEE